MPVNFQQAQKKAKEIGRQAPALQQLIFNRTETACALLEEWATDLSALDALRERATRTNPSLRCAIPGSEALNQRGVRPALGSAIVILAADGSQINPNRHDQVEFGVINTGAFRIQPGSGQAPREMIRTELLFGDELRAGGGPLTEEIVAMRRDCAERVLLAELAAQETLPVVTLTDGQLELYRELSATEEFARLFEEYCQALRELAHLGVGTAGYVDKPRADLLVRLLELALLSKSNELRQAGKLRPLQGVTDVAIFHRLLQPGERSAVFGIQSPSAQKFVGELALHFFYLNVGSHAQPWLARIELPAWVAQSPVLLDRLHAALIDQCGWLGSQPYPYALHRAHEIAVVRFEEKDELENMIIKEINNNHGDIGPQSKKQFSKDISGKRTRYS